MNTQQRYYLDAMGIQLWERRDAAPSEVGVSGDSLQQRVAAATTKWQAAPAHEPALQRVAGTTGRAPEVAATLPLASEDGIPGWLDEAPPLEAPLFDLDEPEIDESDFIPDTAAPAQPDVATLDWPALQLRVSECTQCPELVANRTQTVFGVGSRQAEWMIIGEAPGADEDAQGEPFVGKAGQLLNAMLHASGLTREQVYIANVLKCRPPNNRDPRPEEAAACEAFLQRQIALLQPKVILVVGRIAAQHLLQVETPIGMLRGSVHRYEGRIPVVVTYHPAYLLRSPQEKRKAWADLCLARSVLRGE